MKRPPIHQMSEAVNRLCLALELAETHLPEPARTSTANKRLLSMAQFSEARATLLDQLVAADVPEAAE